MPQEYQGVFGLNAHKLLLTRESSIAVMDQHTKEITAEYGDILKYSTRKELLREIEPLKTEINQLYAASDGEHVLDAVEVD